MKKANYIYLLSALLLLPILAVHSQTISIHHPQLKFRYEDSLLRTSGHHSALQPLKINIESLERDARKKAAKKFFASPVIDAMGGYNANNKTFTYGFAQGGFFSGNLGKKAGFELSAVLYEQNFPEGGNSIDSLKLVPRYNRYLFGKKENAAYASVRGNIWWKANRWLTFTTGNDKHFIGDGQRSLLLSENAAAYPFFQTQLNIWKINYQHQVMFLRDLVDSAGSQRFPKYISQHVLSYSPSERFNFYIFEAVIWRKQDSVRHRNFDLTYLNPFLFYRPVEYNQGSPDNVLMGIGGKWRMFGKNYLFGQFLLDEFNLKYVSKNDGWWGSKYGYQVGFKSYGLFKKRSVLTLEYSQMRPFSYSHSYSLQNYGYLRQPLAHPLGSNFRELAGELRIALSKKWLVHAKGFFQRFGTDPAGKNYGSDIYKKQWSYSKYYGNYIAQGNLNTVVFGEAEINRILVERWRMVAFANMGMQFHESESNNGWHYSVSAGIKTLLYE